MVPGKRRKRAKFPAKEKKASVFELTSLLSNTFLEFYTEFRNFLFSLHCGLSASLRFRPIRFTSLDVVDPSKMRIVLCLCLWTNAEGVVLWNLDNVTLVPGALTC